MQELAKSGTTRFVLSHLSRENNMPDIARQSAIASLGEIGLKENVDFDEPESEFEGAVVSNDADVEENHMIEEIEVDEDEDLLDDMSYDDFDYSNDDNDDYEM